LDELRDALIADEVDVEVDRLDRLVEAKSSEKDASSVVTDLVLHQLQRFNRSVVFYFAVQSSDSLVAEIYGC
jgi:hypothetical protein